MRAEGRSRLRVGLWSVPGRWDNGMSRCPAFERRQSWTDSANTPCVSKGEASECAHPHHTDLQTEIISSIPHMSRKGKITMGNKKQNLRCTIIIMIQWSRYSPGVAQRVGRGIALLFHDRGTRRWWVVSSTPQTHFTPGERHGTHLTGGWVGPRAGLEGRKISSPPGFDLGPSSP